MKQVQVYIFIILMVLVSSCSYIDDKPKNTIVDGSNVMKSCKIDINKLQGILQENVESQINCIKENLENFSRYVRRSDQNTIDRSSLEHFISRFFNKNSESILKSLDLLLELSQVFYNDQNGQIKVENIPHLFNSLIIFNQQAIIIASTIKKLNEEKISFNNARPIIAQAAKTLSHGLLKSIKFSQTQSNTPQQVNLRKLISNITISIQNSSRQVSKNIVDLILKLKLLLLGGNQEIITNKELINFLHKFENLFLIGFDLEWINKKSFSNKYEQNKDLSNTIKNFYTLFKAPKLKQDILLVESDFYKLIDLIFINNQDQNLFFKGVISKTKSYLIDARFNQSKKYTFNNIITLLDYMRLYVEGNGAIEATKKIRTNNNFSLSAKQEYSLEILTRLSISFDTILNENISNFPSHIQLYQFIKYLNRDFDFIQVESKLIDIIFNVKRAILGGEKNTISKNELKVLFKKIPSFYNMASKFIFKEKKESSASLKNKLIETIKLLKNSLTTKDQIILTSDEIIDILMFAFPGEPFDKYKSVIEELKTKFIGGDPQNYNSKDFAKALDITNDLLQNLLYLDIQYSANKKTLEINRYFSPQLLKYKKHHYFKTWNKKEIDKYKKNFKHITLKYKYYRDDKTKSQFWGRKFKRNKSGMIEISLLRWLYGKLQQSYGTEEGFTLEKINDILFMFKPLLVAHDLWSKFIETFGRNMLLLSDLFQSKSDGNSIMSIDEATEYSILALSAMEMADKMLLNFSKEDSSGKIFCKNIGTREKPMYDTICYRKNFFKILLEKSEFKTKLPKLNSYINSINNEQRYTFIQKIEGFARDTRDDSIPIGKPNLSKVIGAMLNVESTFIRFDLNRNNQLDPDELENAYKIYKSGIIKVAKLEGYKTIFTKSIFFYMIEKMSLPTTAQLLRYHFNYNLNPFKKAPIARRLNIGALLYYLVNGVPEEKRIIINKKSRSVLEKMLSSQIITSEQYNKIFEI